MTKDLIVSKRYAEALFRIARAEKRDEEIELELEHFCQALKASAETERFLGNPQVKVSDKRKLLQKIYQERRQDYYELLLNFLTVLFEKSRFHLIHEISSSYKRIADEAQGQAVAMIRSARPLESGEEKAIVVQLEKIAGYKIAVQKEVDPGLIGGVQVRVRHRVLDGTIKQELDFLKSQLKNTSVI